jgi:hypothetical protein
MSDFHMDFFRGFSTRVLHAPRLQHLSKINDILEDHIDTSFDSLDSATKIQMIIDCTKFRNSRFDTESIFPPLYPAMILYLLLFLLVWLSPVASDWPWSYAVQGVTHYSWILFHLLLCHIIKFKPKRDFYKIYIYILQWLAISDKRPRFILVKNVFRIVHSRMCKNTRFGLFTFFGSNKRQTYKDYMGVLGEKCSPKWANFTLKQGENPRLVNTLCLDSFPVCCQLILYISNVAIISKTISLSNIFRNADLSKLKIICLVEFSFRNDFHSGWRYFQ